MKKIITFIFCVMLSFALQSCMGAYAVSSYDNVYSDYDECVVSDINVVITHGTPYYYDGYLSYYFYNGWYYYPYFYNNYWYFRPYRYAFRPGYIPRIHHRPSDLYLRHYGHGFIKPHNGHRGLPRVSDRRFGERRYNPQMNNRPQKPNNRQYNRGTNVRRNYPNIPNNRSVRRNSTMPNTRSVSPRTNNSRPSGRFGGRRN